MRAVYLKAVSHACMVKLSTLWKISASNEKHLKLTLLVTVVMSFNCIIFHPVIKSHTHKYI